MKIFNTLTRRKEELVPLEEGKVKIYACGPTVYYFIHIGNARPICVFDTLRRYLEYRGYEVSFVQNFTDIDDKIIKRANEEGTTYDEIAKKYIAEYWTDVEGMNVRKADIHPKATENIEEIISMVSDLQQKGYAYEVDGDVYFRTKKFAEYGKLSHQPLEDLAAGARIAVGDIKEDPMDFALWKAAKPDEPYWDSPWGHGRPGWHIECSAMNRKYLGETIDIHCGGQDLIFPHHENEIAQSETCNGAPFAKYWMHNGYINVDNEKMSKSLGNFKTVRDVASVYGYEPIRYFIISAHYRKPINYSIEIIEQCKAALERLYNCKENLENYIAAAEERELDAALQESVDAKKAAFIEAMEDDLNTADALAAVFELVRVANTAVAENKGKASAEYALALFNELTDVLGLVYQSKESDSLDAQVEALIEQRSKARAEKNWAEADRIRDELKAMGIILKDTPQGVTWSKE
ncbi:MAG: cysteine--tRNA ligase [Clostridia bacterium]|nr:cysteine--tRNA ligase [Clostridia bacterium]